MTTNDQVQAALKPCPFCGGRAYFYENEVDSATKWSVSCEVCDANIDVCEDTKDEAATHWNARIRATPADPAIDPATVEQQHKLFVEWVKSTRSFTDWSRHHDGYAKPLVDRAWRCWLASRDAAIRALVSGEERS